TTVAGNGSLGFAGDGGAATGASLYFPAGVALDASGNLYIADQDNCRIRKVDAATRSITTVAVNGCFNFGGGGAATGASLLYPAAVAPPARGTIYCSDYSGNRSCLPAPRAANITTVAGNGSLGFAGDGGAATGASLYYPAGVALDASGNLYIADSDNYRIRR